MTWETGSTDHQRMRAGYAVLMIGLFILLFAWAMAVMRGPSTEGSVAVRREKIDPPHPDRVLPVVGAGLLLTGGLLVVVLTFSVVAFLRISRTYRQRLLAPPTPPTPTADVWQMHKVPDIPEFPDDDGLPDEPDAPQSS